MKNVLIEIKNDLQEMNSRVAAAENQISNLKCKEKICPIRTARRKKNLKKMRTD